MDKKVLVVDDEPISLMELRRYLEEACISFEQAQNGQEALSKLKGFCPLNYNILIEEYLLHYDIDNIKSIIRGKIANLSEKEIRKRSALSEAKISLIIAQLEKEGKIQKIKNGGHYRLPLFLRDFPNLFRGQDSDLDKWLQRPLSYHWTTPE